MTYIRAHYRTIILALAIATIFAAIDLYLVNLSSYVCGFLLAGVLLERKRPVREAVRLAKSESVPCPYCGGRTKRIAAKKPRGVEQRRCTSCHRKLQEKNGKLREVAV